jgi:hypothetical protein
MCEVSSRVELAFLASGRFSCQCVAVIDHIGCAVTVIAAADWGVGWPVHQTSVNMLSQLLAYNQHSSQVLSL